MFEMYSKMLESDILKMQQVCMSDWAQKELLSFSALNINKEFRMDLQVREQYPLKNNNELKPSENFKPYLDIVEKLKKIDDNESY